MLMFSRIANIVLKLLDGDEPPLCLLVSPGAVQHRQEAKLKPSLNQIRSGAN